MISDAEKMQRIEFIMQGIAKAIDDCLGGFGDNMGFALIVFELKNPGAVSNYISNVERSSMIKALRETAERLESNEIMPPCIGSVQ